MSYTQDQIEKYLEILKSYREGETAVGTKKCHLHNPSKCNNCQSENFVIYSGHYVCDNCGLTKGVVLGYFEPKEFDRLHFKKKSIYQRKYYYEKKINQVSKRIHLTEEEKYELYSKLMELNDQIIKINKQYERKRLINVFYLIRKILQEMGSSKYKLVYLNINLKTLGFYEKWWLSYKSLNNSSMKKPVKNSS